MHVMERQRHRCRAASRPYRELRSSGLSNAPGFTVQRVSSAHHIMRHPDGRSAVVPVLSRRDMPPGVLRGILASISITPAEFIELLPPTG